jgi:hypothetical protein
MVLLKITLKGRYNLGPKKTTKQTFPRIQNSNLIIDNNVFIHFILIFTNQKSK